MLYTPPDVCTVESVTTAGMPLSVPMTSTETVALVLVELLDVFVAVARFASIVAFLLPAVGITGAVVDVAFPADADVLPLAAGINIVA